MPRFLASDSPNEFSFIAQWTQLAGVSALLSCAERTGVPFAIWGGCVRNFVLDESALQVKDGYRSRSFLDFVDPYSDIDCVVEREEDWQILVPAIAESVAFAGYHRWECQTISQIAGSMYGYARVAAESFLVWHDGYDEKRQPRIRLQVLEGKLEELLRAPLTRMKQPRLSDHATGPWQETFDALRLSRYELQYPAAIEVGNRLVLPNLQRTVRTFDTDEPERTRNRNLLRFDLAVLDLLMTARDLTQAIEYLRALADRLPIPLLEPERILTQVTERYKPTLSYLGALVYRQRNDRAIRLKLLTRAEDNLSRAGYTSSTPWTNLWSLGTDGDDCCRHQDFKNGVAVLSWRANNREDKFSQSQAFELAPVAQVGRFAPYGDGPEAKKPPIQELFSVPGFVHVGASLTLRFDHAYMAQLLNRNVVISVGLVEEEA